MKLHSLLLALSVVLAASTSLAQEPPPTEQPVAPPSNEPIRDDSPVAVPALPFGTKGEYVVTGASNFQASNQRWSADQESALNLVFSPGLDYFFWKNVSLGLTLNASYSNTQAYDGTAGLVHTKTVNVSIGPRIGWSLPLGERFSFYPRLALGGGLESVQMSAYLDDGTEGIIPSHGTVPTLWGDLSLLLLFHPVEHAFIGFGPSVSATIVLGNSGALGPYSSSDLGADFVVGGTWGGERSAREPSTSEVESADELRFGRAHQWAFSSEFGGGLLFDNTSVGEVDHQFWFEPGAEYFVTDALSIGVDLDVSHQSSRVVNLEQSSSFTSVGLVPQVGLNVPLGRWFSVYPRAFFGGAMGHATDTVAAQGTGAGPTATYTSTTTEIWTALYAPLLIHPAPHLFLGFGPNVRHDLLNHAWGQSNLSTTVGANFMVGAWL